MSPSSTHPGLSLEDKIRIYALAEEILSANGGLITTETMVIVPCYLGEERRKELIDTLADQQGDFIAVVYLNGSLEKFSEHTYKKMLTTIKKYAKKSKRILIIGHLYDEKPRLGAIRADLIDAIADCIDIANVKTPKLIGLDADTYKLDQQYITSMAKKLNTTNGRLSADLRRYDEQQSKGDERAFLVERVFVFAMLESRKRNDDLYFAGASFGIKLADYQKAGGFNRTLVAGEDIQLGADLKAIGLKGYHFPKKVYVDPRRGQHIVNLREADQYGKKCFIQQRERQTLPVFTKEQATPQYKELTAISRKLLYGNLISPLEQKRFEQFFNELHFFGTIREGKSDRERGLFIARRNTALASRYKMLTLRDKTTGAAKIQLRMKKK